LIGYDPGMSQLFLVAVVAAGSTVFPVEALHWTRGEQGTRAAALWGDLETGPGAIMLDWPPGLREGRHRHTSDLSIAMIAGTMELTLGDGAPVRLAPGSAALIPGGTVHSALCRKPKHCVFFATMSGKFDQKEE
jgi:quercetin dioxygenase-like cupin family protein